MIFDAILVDCSAVVIFVFKIVCVLLFIHTINAVKRQEVVSTVENHSG